MQGGRDTIAEPSGPMSEMKRWASGEAGERSGDIESEGSDKAIEGSTGIGADPM